MSWQHHVWTSAGSVVMIVIMLVFLMLLGVAAVLAVQASRRPPQSRDAEQLLAQRFARGEIDADEYQRRTALLRSERR